MFEEIISLENLLRAWHEFRRGKRGKQDVQVYERHIEDHLFTLHEELRNGTYWHGPYECFHIFDPKHRIIHKAVVSDRIIHHAVYRVLAPLFERSFIFDSFSCRIDKGTHAGVERLAYFLRKVRRNYTRPVWALKCDIKKFFDSINHVILRKLIGRRISDMYTMRLLQEIIGSFYVSGNRGGGLLESQLEI